MTERRYHNSTFKIRDDAKSFTRRAPLNCRRKRGDLSGMLSKDVYASQLKRTQLKPKPLSKKQSLDGDDAGTIKRDCDQIVRDIIAVRDKFCISCGGGGRLEVGHLFRRGHERVRWNLMNVAGQHSRCNNAHNEDQDAYIEGFIQKFGEEAYTTLRKLSRDSRKLSYVELLKTRDDLRATKAALYS